METEWGQYSYEVRFTDDAYFPWKYAIYLDGKLLGNNQILRYTGSASTLWGAKSGARKFIRKHRRYRGKVIRVGQ